MDLPHPCVWTFVPNHKLTLYSGGEEVMLDVGGQDATELFEDVGHSDEARTILDGLLIGSLKRLPGDPVPKSIPKTRTDDSSEGLSMSVVMYALALVGAAVAWYVYQNHQKQQATTS
jgi:cytochrome b involved in lipid metabolism